MDIAEDLKPPSTGTTIIECTGKIITPGFVDTNHHVWQTLLKGRHADELLLDYIYTGAHTCQLNFPSVAIFACPVLYFASLDTLASKTQFPTQLIMLIGNLQSSSYAAGDIFWGQLGGCLEALDDGTTTIVDHAHCTQTPAHGAM